jgi:hypothetical protein
MVWWQMTLFVIVTRLLSVAKGGNALNYVILVIVVNIRSHWNNHFLFALVLLNMIMEKIAQTILVLKNNWKVNEDEVTWK